MTEKELIAQLERNIKSECKSYITENHEWNLNGLPVDVTKIDSVKVKFDEFDLDIVALVNGEDLILNANISVDGFIKKPNGAKGCFIDFTLRNFTATYDKETELFFFKGFSDLSITDMS